MNEYPSDKTKNYNRTFIIIYIVLLSITTIAIAMLIFQTQYIYPRFERQLLSNTENEAVRMAKYMMRAVLEGYSGGKLAISDEIRKYFDDARKDSNLWKIKIFSNSGETIYSTSDEEVGEINKNTYFRDIVSKTQNSTSLLRNGVLVSYFMAPSIYIKTIFDVL